MKKFFQYLGLICLVVFSFFYTEKTVSVVKELDEIMIQIKEEQNRYQVEPINAIIHNDTIIPGIYGREIDINKSYQNMRKLGHYHHNLLVYKKIKPEISLNNNYHKYIVGGNKSKKQVSLIFMVDNDDIINNVLNILNKNSLKGNFFLTSQWLKNNNRLAIQLIEQGHNVGNLSNNFDYQSGDYIWMDTIIKKIGKQKKLFCYATDNKKDLEICAQNKNYTIKPNIIVNNYPLIEVKEKLVSGSIISFKINNTLERELELIISHIKSKDLEIVNLIELLEE
ncbi:MAG: polysaccharide deacetylase family protein [Bacilli bacterium]|nr:polysaccharide deacetylase family protein [Bacilli bacterium]MDD4809362.1 polysaccharide deacetylase family protein [Bacilli bacterium]